MTNAFIETIRTANDQKWCTKVYCTTCGAHDYRKALQKLGGELGGGLANVLAELNPSELTKEHGWQDALLLTIHDLPLSLQLRSVLKSWLPKIHEDVDFSDFVLFKIIRNMPGENDVKKEWIARCIMLVQGTKDFSLTESLLLVLKKESLKYPVLMKIAIDHAESSRQMRRVLQNVCGIGMRDV
jgi:hypothetical protein